MQKKEEIMILIKKLKRARILSVLTFVAVSIVLNTAPHLSSADPTIDKLGDCFGGCAPGDKGNACKDHCFGIWKKEQK